MAKVRLLAYLIAEGGLTRIYPIFTNTDPVLIEDFQQIITTHFPQCAVKQFGLSYTVAQPRNATTMQGGAILPKNPVTVWLEELGLMGKSAKEKFFPPCVWKWSRRYLAEFLKMHLHDLRHSAATILLSMGVNPKQVQELLGHSQITMTIGKYGHVLPSMQKEIANKFNDLFS